MRDEENSHINRPGKPSISYRLRTHSGFLKRMQERLYLQRTGGSAFHPLSNLNSLSVDDPAMALLDAWATVADVLTFYQERMANEGFISTATERNSVLHLARSVGYRLFPGSAASCFLAFTVEDAQGSPKEVTVPQRTRVESIPLPGEMPAVFETDGPLNAKAEHNVLLPERWKGQEVGDSDTRMMLAGTATQLSPGDTLLFVSKHRQTERESSAWCLRILDSVSANIEGDCTSVIWKEPLDGIGPVQDTDESGLQIFAFREKNASLFGSTAPTWDSLSRMMKKSFERENGRGKWPEPEIKKIKGRYVIDLDGHYPGILKDSWVAVVDPRFGPRLCQASEVITISRSDYSLNARITRVLPEEGTDLSQIDLRQAVVFAESELLKPAKIKRTLPPQKIQIELDCQVFGLEKRKTLIVRGKRMRARVLAKDIGFYPKEFGRNLLPGDVLVIISRLDKPEINEENEWDGKIPREEKWMMMDSDGYVGILKCWSDDIKLLPSQEKDDPVSEKALMISSFRDDKRTTLILDSPLSNFYDPQTMEIFANVVSASHGETVNEVIGSGDGTAVNQSFALKRKPLTFTSAKNPGASLSTLQVTVDKVLWDECDSFIDMDESSRGFVLKIDEMGAARIVFGDGKRGSRLPTGVENITAVYRFGLGPEGNVPADGLCLLPSRPPGIRSVFNPIAASGAAPPEPDHLVKLNAPKTLMTLDRLVSLLDYESFAGSFMGIGKASATEVLTNLGRMVYITICAQDGSQVDPSSELYHSLVEAIKKRSRPIDRFKIFSSYRLLTFGIEARLVIDRRYSSREVEEQCKAALRDQFSFFRRDFAQDVAASEILACLQKVEGVISARLDDLRIDPSGSDKGIVTGEGRSGMQVQQKNLLQRAIPIQEPSANAALSQMLPGKAPDGVTQILKAKPAVNCNGIIMPAEILLINPDANAIKLDILELKA